MSENELSFRTTDPLGHAGTARFRITGIDDGQLEFGRDLGGKPSLPQMVYSVHPGSKMFPPPRRACRERP